MRRVAWFSCGAASAVAAKLTVDTYGADAKVVYCDTMASEHPDNRRFFDDVQRWLGVEIEIVRSAKYDTIDDVFARTRYMAGIGGARCTTEMKKLPRLAWQQLDDVHVFGYTAEERKRADDFEERNPNERTEWILIDNWITKAMCLDRIRAAGIAMPMMYSLNFDHNNCLGCVKATSPGYWNRTREHFPEVFDRRAKQSRLLNVRLARVGDERVFLDELPSDLGGPDDDIECGPVCQIRLPGFE